MAWWGKIKTTLEQKPYLLTLALAGILVLVSGLAFLGIGFKGSGEEIQIIESADEATPSASTIFVDVGGAVEKPGLYELTAGARANDALIAAGGLAGEADRDWVSQNLNLAAKLTDGAKLYVPFREDSGKVGPSQNKGPTFSDLININSASLAELDTLWGVGPATAQKIIDGRPYSKIEELLEKKIVKTNVYEAIKDQITVL